MVRAEPVKVNRRQGTVSITLGTGPVGYRDPTEKFATALRCRRNRGGWRRKSFHRRGRLGRKQRNQDPSRGGECFSRLHKLNVWPLTHSAAVAGRRGFRKLEWLREARLHPPVVRAPVYDRLLDLLARELLVQSSLDQSGDFRVRSETQCYQLIFGQFRNARA